MLVHCDGCRKEIEREIVLTVGLELTWQHGFNQPPSNSQPRLEFCEDCAKTLGFGVHQKIMCFLQGMAAAGAQDLVGR